MSNTTTTKARELKQWEDLANEAISDAGYWKRRARYAEEHRDALLGACKGLMLNFVPSRDKFTRIEQDKAFNSARAAITQAEGRAK